MRGITTHGQQAMTADRGLPSSAALTLAVCVGAAVPAVAFGKAVMGVVLVPAGIVALMALSYPDIRQAVLRAVLSPPGLALCLFGGASLVSVAMSQDVPKSLESWARTAAFILFGLTAAQVLARDRRALALARRCLVVASVVTLGFVVAAVYVSEDVLALIAWGKDEVEPATKTFKGFASAVVCLMPVALWASAGPGLPAKALRLGILAMAALAVWLDGVQTSLAGILGIFCALLLIGLVDLIGRLQAPWRAVAAVGVVLTGLGLAVAVTAALPSAGEKETARLTIPTWLVDAHRQAIWRFTVDAAAERPLLGYGPNTINLIEGADRVSALHAGEYIPSHPHNWIYEIASETGLVGLFALVAGLLLVLRRMAVAALNGHRSGWVMLAVFGAFWGSALTNFSIWATWWQLTFIVLISIPAAQVLAYRRDSKKERAAG